MTIELNHLIVPAHDKEKSARFYELGFYQFRLPLCPVSP